MEIIAVIGLYIACGAVSTGFFKIVEDWYVDVDGETAPFIVMLWPVFWIFFLLRVITWPLFAICEAIFD